MSMICNSFCIAVSFRSGEYFSEQFGIDNEEYICFSNKETGSIRFNTIEDIRAYVEERICLTFDDQGVSFSDWFEELGDITSYEDFFDSLKDAELSDLDSVVLLIVSCEDDEDVYYYEKVQVPSYKVSKGVKHPSLVQGKYWMEFQPYPLDYLREISNPLKKTVVQKTDSDKTVSKKTEPKTEKPSELEEFERNFTHYEPYIPVCGEGYYIGSYVGTSTTVRVPETVDGKRVVYISGLGDRPDVERVEIPESVEVNEKSFRQYKKLYDENGNLIISGKLLAMAETGSVCKIPAGVHMIGSNLINIEWGDKNETIEELMLPEGLQTIESSAFKNCLALRKVTFPESLQTIGVGAFADCYSLTEIILPEGLVTIEGNAFARCKALEKVVFPKNLKTIGAGAFSDCKSLKHVDVSPETEIQEGAFRRCLAGADGLTIVNGILFNVDFSAHQKFIGNTEKGTAKVQVPDTVHTIDDYAISWIGAIIEEVTIPDTVKRIVGHAFNLLGIKAFRLINHATGKLIFKTTKFKSSYSATTHLDESSRFQKMCECICGGDYAGLAEYGTVYPEHFPKENDRSAEKVMRKKETAAENVPEKEPALEKTEKETDGTIADRNEGGVPEIIETESDEGIGKTTDTVSETKSAKNDPPAQPKKRRASAGFTVTAGGVASTFTGDTENVVVSNKVIEIGSECFNLNAKIKSISLPEKLVRIAPKAFFGCKFLTQIEIPAGTKEIGSDAFRSCVSLADIFIPESVTTIGANALYTRCPDLIVHVVPDSEAEQFCKENGITYDNQSADNYRPRKVNTIAEETEEEDFRIFRGKLTHYLGKAKHVIVPDKVKKIEENAFCGDPYMVTCKLSAGLNSLCSFENCSALQEITLPDDLKAINRNTFSGCSSLTDLHLPDSLQSIGDFAFSGCNNLTDIHLPDGLQSIGAWAFEGCSNLTNIDFPEGLKIIGSYSFEECSELKEVKLPENLIQLGDSPFSGCSSLSVLHLPDGWEKIGDQMFENLTALEEIVLPSGIKQIGKWAFSGCSSLKKIDFPDGLEEIGDYAFRECSELKEIKLPEKLKQLGDSAFSGCSSLSVLHLPDGLQKDNWAWDFYDCKNVRTLTIPFIPSTNNQENLDPISLSFYFPRLETVTFSKKWRRIAGISIKNCSSLKTVILQKGVESIGPETFQGCTQLVNIALPDELQTIGNNAFSGCTKLAEIALPARVQTIDYQAFRGCSSLSKIIMPRELRKIGFDAFKDCPKLKTVEISHSVFDLCDVQTQKQITSFNQSCLTCLKSAWHEESTAVNIIQKVYQLADECVGKRYDQLCAKMKVTKNSHDWQSLEHAFRKIGSCKDALAFAEECTKSAEQCRLEEYESAKAKMEKGKYREAEKMFLELGKYKDSAKMMNDCFVKAVEQETAEKYDELEKEMHTASCLSDWKKLYRGLLELEEYRNAKDLAEQCHQQILEIEHQIEIEEVRKKQVADRIASLLNEKREQERIIEQNKGLGALFGQKAKLRKSAEARLIEINKELDELKKKCE